MTKYTSVQTTLTLHYYNMEYQNKNLIFESNSIYYLDETSPTGKREVMMSWEDNIMSASAKYVAENGGNILEIGFGMGISANYIQSYSPTSHIIVEIHPQIIPIAQAWAEGKSGVQILQGDWYEIRELITQNGLYDGIFHDTYGDKNRRHILDFCGSIIKTGGRFTLWNEFSKPLNLPQFQGAITHDIISLSDIQVPDNDYFMYSEYYLPKIQF